MADQIINPSFFNDFDPGFIQDIFKVYISENEKALEKLIIAYQNKNFEELRFWSHKMNSSAKMIRADLLTSVASVIENAATNKEQIDEKQIEEIKLRFQEIKIYVKEVVDSFS